MIFKCIAAPMAEPVTVAEARLDLGIDGAEHDARLLDLIADVREAAESRTRRAILPQQWEAVLDRFPCGAEPVKLPAPPVRGVVSVSYVDANGQQQPLPGSAWLLDADAEPAYLFPAYGTTWPETRLQPGAVRIRVDCGWATPADVPRAIRRWIRLHVAHLFDNPAAASAETFTELPFAAGLLDPWRIIEIA